MAKVCISKAQPLFSGAGLFLYQKSPPAQSTEGLQSILFSYDLIILKGNTKTGTSPAPGNAESEEHHDNC